MKKVFLYGDLKRRFCNSIEVDVSDITDLVHALEANFDGFTHHVIRRYIEGNEYAFLKKDPKKIETQEDLQNSIVSKDSDYILNSKEKEVHIIPFSSGGVVAGFFTNALLGKIVSSIVWAAVAQVAMNILFKPPKQRTPKTISTKSMILNAKANSTSQGSPVPVGYGRLRVGAANILTYQSNRTTSGSEIGLESASEIEFVDLISEGPIGGFADEKGLPVGGNNVSVRNFSKSPQESEENMKGIYLNETPVLGSHGFRNYILNERENNFPEICFGVNDPAGSVINKAAYMKNYDLDLVGPSFENLTKDTANAVATTVAAAYLLPKDVINQSGLPVSHRIYNENIDIVTFALTSQQQHQNASSGDTQARKVIFSISYTFGLNSSNNNEAVGTPVQSGFEKNDDRSSFFTPGISPVKDQFFMSDAVGGDEYGLFSHYENNNNLFHTHGVASSAFQFDISVRFSEETKSRIKNEGITFRILKHSVELDPAAKGDIGGANNVQSLKLDYAQEITAVNFSYPNSAICKLMVDGKNFSSSPERTYHLFLKKVLVPSNYDPVSRTYDGAWAGSFHRDGSDEESVAGLDDTHRCWTNNPAWIYFDLITNPRFGLGKNGVDYEFVNKWQLYKIAKYCDELVSTSYPIETSDGNLVDFKYQVASEAPAVDHRNTFTIKVGGDSGGYNRSLDDFGEGTKFAGKMMAFFVGENPDVNDSSKNLNIYQRELVSVTGNEITLKGPSLPTKIKNDQKICVGGCALQKNHKIVEPRFSCNIYINEKSEALDLINKLASVFRSINSYLGGKIYAIQDVPQDPIQIFNNSNVANGEFNYSTADKKRRITACVVQFVNEDKNYDVDSVYEEDAFAMQRFGFVQEEIVGFGVTSSSQARRLARWNLITSQSENEIIKFNVSQEGAYLYPNSIIEVSDENRISKEKSGRIKSMGESYTKISGGSEIVIDKPYFELDKDITKTPSGTPVEIKVARGVGNTSIEDLDASLDSQYGSDQDVMIEGLFSKQIARFQGVLSQVENSYGFQNIITDLRLKKSIKVDVLENFIECSEHGFEQNQAVSFSSDGILPAGIKASSVYSVRNVRKNSFQLSILGQQAIVEIFDKGKSDLMENGGQHYVYYSNESKNRERVIAEMNTIAFGAAYNISGFSADIAEDIEESSEGNILSVLNNLVNNDSINNWYAADFLGDFFVPETGDKFHIYSTKLEWVYISPTSNKDSLIIYNDPFGWMYKPQYISDNWWYIYEKKSWAFLRDGGDDYVFILGQDYQNQYNVGDIFPFKLGKTYKVVAKFNTGSPGVWISSGGAWDDRDEYTVPSELDAPALSAPSSRVVAIESYEYISANDSIQGKDSVVVNLFSSNDIDYNAVSEFFINESSEGTLQDQNWGVIFRGGGSFELIDSTHSLGFDGGDAGAADNVSIEMDFSMLSERYFRSQLYRVLSVKEAKGNSYEVIASEYNSSKYRAADSSGLVESPILPLPPQANMHVPSAPSNLRIDLTST